MGTSSRSHIQPGADRVVDGKDHGLHAASPSEHEPASEQMASLRGDDEGGERIGLIDAVQLTRDCLMIALRSLWPDVALITFASVKDCLHASDGGLKVILFHSHHDGAFESIVLQEVSALHVEFPRIPIILLADSRDGLRAECIRDALRNGARGVIPMATTEIRKALAAIRFVEAGGIFAPADILLRGQSGEAAHTPDTRNKGALTTRQLSVLARLRTGKPNKVIAYELGVKESTVKVHVRNIMRKLGVCNRIQAAFRADQVCSLTDLACMQKRPQELASAPVFINRPASRNGSTVVPTEPVSSKLARTAAARNGLLPSLP